MFSKTLMILLFLLMGCSQEWHKGDCLIVERKLVQLIDFGINGSAKAKVCKGDGPATMVLKGFEETQKVDCFDYCENK